VIKLKSYFKFFLLLVSIVSIEFTANSQQLKNVTLQLKWKHQFQFAGYYAAIEKGYYKDAGIDVKLLEAVEGQNPSDAVFNGKADFGVCTSDIILMRSEGKEAVVLASVFQHSPLILIGSRKSGINHVHDLFGKIIALEPNSADIVAYMNDEGIPLDKCTIDQHPFDVDKLLKGEVDAISAYSTDEPFQLREVEYDYTIITPQMGGIDFYGDVLFTTENLIRKDLVLVNSFRDASLKGWKYAMDHPDEIIDLIFNKYSKRHSLEHLKFEASHMKNLIMNDVVEIGYTNPGRWESISETYKKMNMLSPSFSTEGLLYSEYLTPEINLPWKLIAIYFAVIMIISSAAYFFYNTSRKLKKEIANRILIEKNLVFSEARYRSILNASPDGIAITDLEGRILMASPSAIHIFGCKQDTELIGKFIADFFDPLDHDRALSSIKSMFSGVISGPGEFKGLQADGSAFFVESNAEFVRDSSGEPSQIIYVVRDITERKKVESKIKTTNDELSKLIAEKDKFFSIISHDLRSPFNGFLGLTQIMVEELPTLTLPEIQSYAVSLRDSATRLFRLLENLLNWARMQQGLIPFYPEKIHLLSKVAESLTFMQESAKIKRIEITNDIPSKLFVFTDNNTLQTVIRNLISNAIKFTPKDGKVNISAHETGNGTIEISIKDSGIGMNKELIEDLFRLDTRTTRNGTEGEPSTGLGLLLCKEFIEKHNGKLWVESKEGEGSTFYFSVPSVG